MKKVILLPISFIILLIIGCNATKNAKQNGQKILESTSNSTPSADHKNTKETEDENRFYELTRTLQDKYEAGKIEEAKSSIVELKNLLPKFENNWNYGNAVHKMNIVAGRIALLNGKIEEAKMYLIAAGKTKGSPQLNSFGPNTTLVKELLEKQEREIVIEFFDLCSVFWKSEFSKINEWKYIVNKGEIPKFGAHLKY